MDESTVASNLSKLFPDGKGAFLAYDQGIEHGPTDFSEQNADPAVILKIAAAGHYDGVILHQGIAQKYYAPHAAEVPLILKLNGKTSLHDDEPISLAIASVAEAQKLGATAVGYTVYVGSQHEAEMLAEFGRIVDEAHDAGLPVFGWMYPRGKSVKDPKDPQTIAYAARVGLEVGADAVKIYYPGSADNVRDVVKLAGQAKVVIAGGVKQDPPSFITQVKGIIAAGAAGVAAGRNVWQAAHPDVVSRQLVGAVHG